jgi:hypothetical protein
MTHAVSLVRRSTVLVLALAAACALAAPASAMRSTSALSPNLAELAKPSVQGLSHAAQARKLGVAVDGPGSLIREGNRVLVDVRFGHGALARLEAIRAAGGRIVTASSRYQTVTVAIAPYELHELASVRGVSSVGENRAPLVFGEPTTSAVGAECEGGSVISEGVKQLHAAEARSKYGVDGSGVTVGILSDSFNKASSAATHASEDVASGDLPGSANSCEGEKTPVKVLEDAASEEGDEGRAMAQIVHDVAPGASLAFATAFKSEGSFAKNIERLAKPVGEEGAGADVIVDDVAWFEEPFFQEGPIATAVDKVEGQGVTYLSAAGNDNLFEGKNEIASWEAPSFRDANTCPGALSAQSPCMDFNPAPGPGEVDNTFGITVAKGKTLTLDLQWNEPRFGVKTDLDAFLLDGKGEVLDSSTENNPGDLENEEESATQEPFEILRWKNSTSANAKVDLAIVRCFGEECNPKADPTTKPRLKFILLENGSGVTETEYPKSKGGDLVGPTIFGHAAAADAVSVAAIPYSSNTSPEPYSSRGPVTYYFGPVTSTVAAAPLSTSEELQKPDVTATDCGATTFFFRLEADATWHFCGTSAAAPHAAGVVALEREAEPLATSAEVRSALESTATPIGSFGPNEVGKGLVNADKAVRSLLPPSTVSVIGEPASRTKDSTPSFEFEVNPVVPVTCSIDKGPSVQQCLSPFTSPPLEDGSHVFEVEVEGGGDKASFSFTVDTTAPTASFTKKPGSFTSIATPTFAFSANEPAAFTCMLDGTGKPCTSPYVASTPLADGPHTFSVTPTDQVGNKGAPVEVKFTVDTVTPVVAFTRQPPEISSEKDPTFEFTASEPVSLLCSLDEGPSFVCGSPFVANTLSDGHHTFEVMAIDKANNVGVANAGFTVDTKRPQTSFGARPRKLVRIRQRKVELAFRFHSNESGSNFICKVDRDLFRFCKGRIVRRLGAGSHVVSVKAQDPAGNVDRTPAVYRFKVKRVR